MIYLVFMNYSNVVFLLFYVCDWNLWSYFCFKVIFSYVNKGGNWNILESWEVIESVGKLYFLSFVWFNIYNR